MNNIVSIILPSRNERFLPTTIVDLLKKAEGEIEIIAILDGYWTNPNYFEPNFIKDYEIMTTDPRVTLLHRGQALGMRPGINDAVAIAKGDYIMKIDAHCMVSAGYDLELKNSCKENQVMIPRRKRLEAENEEMTELLWRVQDVGKLDIDYEYLSFPDNPSDFGGPGFNGRIWDQRTKERLNDSNYDIDLNMSFQGSCWFMHKTYFHKLDLMDYENYGTFWSEAQEIGFKCFLSGGQVVTNKKVWYAHLHKGKKYGRGYNIQNRTIQQGAMFSVKWLKNDAWDKQTLPFHKMIEMFWPIPGWPEDWMEVLGYDLEKANAKFKD